MLSQGLTSATCDAVLVSAPASGQGKTTVTAAMARWNRQQGRRVRVFKTGPDFLDPMVLERASGFPVYQLDLWMGGEDHCREMLYRAASEADVILVEGVMGLHDGTPSSADLAQRFGIPVLAVVDGSAMAQTFGALAHGLATYRPGVPFAGVLANRVGSATHMALLKESLPPGLRWFGALPRDEALALPERHLGLVQAAEVADLEARIDHAAQAIGPLINSIASPVSFAAPPQSEPLPQLLAGVRIAVARDAAFSFIYAANLDTLRNLGAELVFFSPLRDSALPDAHSLYLPGGYPELHLQQLSANTRMRDAVRAHHAKGLPIVAECGGMLVLLDQLAAHDGVPVSMWGLLQGNAALQKRFVNLGLHAVQLPEGLLHGHSF
ncbi:MAG: cobyrinate a,c-diamide synthase, partial [Pseudohongiella sp.]|nr:cobyrinate a,c-diamide synthase [Pseudohongiella sp.]